MIPRGCDRRFGGKWSSLALIKDLCGTELSHRLLLGTLPPEKKAWDDSSHKSRDSYYVGILAIQDDVPLIVDAGPRSSAAGAFL